MRIDGFQGWMSAEVNWAIVSGFLPVGQTNPLGAIWGFEGKGYGNTPHANTPPTAWTDTSHAVATGRISAFAEWNKCVCPGAKSFTAKSSVAVSGIGPNVFNKSGGDQQAGPKYQWTTY
jgi:hypothetical protein